MRNGEHIWSRDKVLASWCEVGLSLRGSNQVDQAAHLLGRLGLNFEDVYSSELERGRVSAKRVINKLHLHKRSELHSTWKLNERHFGELSGFTPESEVLT